MNNKQQELANILFSKFPHVAFGFDKFTDGRWDIEIQDGDYRLYCIQVGDKIGLSTNDSEFAPQFEEVWEWDSGLKRIEYLLQKKEKTKVGGHMLEISHCIQHVFPEAKFEIEYHEPNVSFLDIQLNDKKLCVGYNNTYFLRDESQRLLSWEYLSRETHETHVIKRIEEILKETK